MPHGSWKLLALTLLACICFGDHSLDAFQEPMDQPAAPPSDVLGESPLLFEPTTLEEHFEAVLQTVRLARPRLARQYLERMMAMNPTEADLLALRDEYGPAPFLNLANVEELRPLSTQLLTTVSDAFRRRALDPARINGLIDDLSGTPQERETAVIALRNTGAVAVPQMLRRIADANPDLQNLLTYTLTRMGDQVVAPLIAAIESPVEPVRSAAIEALGFLGSRTAVPYLWAPAFAPNEPPGIKVLARQALARILKTGSERVDAVTSHGVAGELRKMALEHYQRKHVWTVEDDGLVPFWTWSAADQTVVPVRLTPEMASLFDGTRFARQTLAMSPENREAQALFLGLALSLEMQQAGVGRPIPTGPGTAFNLALTSGEEVVAATLAQALATGNGSSAYGAVQALGQIGTAEQLLGTGPQDAPLLAALNYPDPRVQFAAATAILQLDPARTFRGSDRIVQILARALNDAGLPHVLVVDADAQRAATVAGLMGQLGYDPHIAQTGQAGFRLATERNDIELVLLEINTLRWPLSQTIANFRADSRTAHLPIAIYGREVQRGEVQWMLDRYPFLTFLVESSTSENYALQLRPFLESLRAPALTAEQRAIQRTSAAWWLAHLAGGQRNRIFDLKPAAAELIAAAQAGPVALNAIRALGGIPTIDSQSALHEIAVNGQLAAENRESAALQLAFHIQRFGLLLTREQVLGVENAWRSEQDPQVATALASVVGSLKPNAARVTGRLQQFTPPTVPVQPPAAN